MQTPHYSVRWTGLWSWTVNNSLNNVNACMPLTQDCPPRLLDLTVCIVPALVSLSHQHTHDSALDTPEASKLQTPPYFGQAVVVLTVSII